MEHRHGEDLGTHDADLGENFDANFDEDTDEDLDGAWRRAAPVPGGWPSRLVVAVVAVPPLVLGEVARRHLSGSLDARYFGDAFGPADGDVADLDWSTRFSLLWTAVPVPEVLLAALVALLVLCALVVAGSPAWLVPGRWGRRVAAAAAVLTAAESLLTLLTLLSRAEAPERDTFEGLSIAYYVPPTGRFPELAPVLALLAVTTLLPAVAALVLWRGEDAPAGTAAGGDEPPAAVPASPPPAPVVVAPVPPEAPAAPEVPGIPTVPAEQLDAYRRPGG